MDLSTTLDECLARLVRGESVDACLAAHPEHATELAPLLAMAAQLRSTLPHVQLTQGQRLRTKIALREAIAAQSRSSATSSRAWHWRRLIPTMGFVAVLVAVVVTAAMVVSSKPGSAGYSLRLVVEQVPVLTAFGAPEKAGRELALAERRLSELRDELMVRGKVHQATLDDLLRLEAAALSRAALLSTAQQATITSQVAAHALELAALAGMAADADSLARLQSAEEQVRQLAQQQFIVSEPDPPASSPTPTPTQPAQQSALRSTPLAGDGAGDTRPTPTPFPALSSRGEWQAIRPLATVLFGSEPPNAAPPVAVLPTTTRQPTGTPAPPQPSPTPSAAPTMEAAPTPAAPAAPTAEPEPEQPTAVPTDAPVEATTVPSAAPTETIPPTPVDVPLPPGMGTPVTPAAGPRSDAPAETSVPAVRHPTGAEKTAKRFQSKDATPTACNYTVEDGPPPTVTVSPKDQGPHSALPKVNVPAAPKLQLPPGHTMPKRKP